MREPYERLRFLRERAGLKRPLDAANRYGWNPNTYKSHENGVRDISRDAARRYARTFRVSVDWLLDGVGTPDAVPPSAEDMELLAQFHALPSQAQQAVRAMIRTYIAAAPDADEATGQAETTQNYAGDRPFGAARRSSTSPASGAIEPNPTLPTSNGSPSAPRRRAGGGKR